MMPIPMPAPIEPRPAPMPRAIDFSPSSVTPEAAWASGITRSMDAPFLVSSMGLGGRAADVDRGKCGEDERLEGGDQDDLEDEEEEDERECRDSQRREAQQNGEPAAHEQDQQVAGEDVGEKSHGERDEPHEMREHLDDEDQPLADRVHVLEPGRQPAREVLEEALLADPLDVVGDPHDEREHERDREVGG